MTQQELGWFIVGVVAFALALLVYGLLYAGR